jgi:single stranded DNA-binding protein
MRSINRVMLFGRIGHPPELTTSKNGQPFTRLSVATDRYRGKDHDSTTDWHSVFVFGEEAERCVRWLGKGAHVFVEGNLNYWKQDKKGDERENPYRNSIHADRVHFITYGQPADRTTATGAEILDNSSTSRNHNAVAHL